MKTKAFAHQKEAIQKAYPTLIDKGYYALLMGLGSGKTRTSLEIMETLFLNCEITGCIVVCPKPIMSTWENEINIHLGKKGYNIVLWDSIKAKGKKYTTNMEYFLRSLDSCILIVNIEAFQTSNVYFKYVLESFIKMRKTLCILDESSKIKNHKANRTKRLLKYSTDIPYKLIMTGTEITNSVLDVYTQFEFLKKNFWYMRNFYQFQNRYAVLQEISLGNRSFKKVVGFRKVHELLEKIDSCSFRIRTEDCTDLPGLIEQKIITELNKDQRKVYDTLKNQLWVEYKDQELTVTNAVSLLVRFRQIAGGFMPESGELIGKNNPKLETILSEEHNNKAVIWCVFNKEIEYLQKHLPDSLSFYGETVNRAEVLKSFEHDDNVQYLIANPSVGAYGLNLQFSHIAYWYSLPLSPEVYIQAQGRQYRTGQKNKVICKYLLGKDTIDNRVYQLLKNKEDLRNKFQTMTIDDFFKVV